MAGIVHQEDLWQLCRDELTGVDVRIDGWDICGRSFGVVGLRIIGWGKASLAAQNSAPPVAMEPGQYFISAYPFAGTYVSMTKCHVRPTS